MSWLPRCRSPIGAARHLPAHRHRAVERRAGAQERQAAGAGHAVERRHRRPRRIFADVFGEEEGRPASPSGVLEDRAERFAREAAEYWLENMRRVGSDEKALSHYGVDRQHLGWLIDELVVGAHRLRLIDQLSLDVRALENAANAKWEEIAERQVRTAASALNGYVSALGFDQIPVDQRPGLPPHAPTRRVFESPRPPEGAPMLSEDPGSIYADYCRDWMRAFLQLAMDNVGYEGGRRSPRSRTNGWVPSCARSRWRPKALPMPLRAYVQPQPEPGNAVLRVIDLDALPEGLTLSIQRQQGPDTHLADDGWRRTEAWLQPEHVARVKGDLEFHLGPEICDRLAGVATIRLRVKEPDIGVVGMTVVAWPPMLTSGAVDPSRRGQDDTIRLRGRQPEPLPPPPAPPFEPPPVVEPPPPPTPMPDLRAARDPLPEIAPSRGRTGWMIAAAILLLLAGGGYFAYTNYFQKPEVGGGGGNAAVNCPSPRYDHG